MGWAARRAVDRPVGARRPGGRRATSGATRVRAASAGGLSRIEGPVSLQALLDLAGDPAPEVRTSAYMALGAVRTPEAVQGSLVGLQDPSREVRLRVAHMLAVFTPPGVADALLATLQDDESASVRVAAGMGLARMGDGRAVPILLERLSIERHDFERAGAADALGMLGVQEAIKPLTELLNDEEGRVRRAARLALVEILEQCPDRP